MQTSETARLTWIEHKELVALHPITLVAVIYVDREVGCLELPFVCRIGC